MTLGARQNKWKLKEAIAGAARSSLCSNSKRGNSSHDRLALHRVVAQKILQALGKRHQGRTTPSTLSIHVPIKRVLSGRPMGLVLVAPSRSHVGKTWEFCGPRAYCEA